MSKTINDLIKTLSESPLMRVKEFSAAIDNLNNNSVNLREFLNNNSGILDIAKPYDVASFLGNVISAGIDKGQTPKILKNVYDEYSIIFVLNMLAQTSNKTHRLRLAKIFKDLILNTSKFDIYAKVTKNVKLVSSSNDTIFETFWLIPLMVNFDYLIKMDYETFIQEMVELSVSEPDFSEGYQFFVTANYEQCVHNKDNFKQFLLDSSNLK